MWADILIEKKEIKRVPRKGKKVIEILEVFSGSPADVVGLRAGQQLLVSKRADDWEGLEEAKSKGPISLTVLNEDGGGGVELGAGDSARRAALPVLRRCSRAGCARGGSIRAGF